MAYAANELVGALTSVPGSLRVWPEHIHPKTLAAVAGPPTYAKLSPMAFNTVTGFWVIWASGGADGTGTIGGFLDEATLLSATGETLANMIMAGQIDYRDIPLPTGQTQPNLLAALVVGMRAKGFDIVGVAGVY